MGKPQRPDEGPQDVRARMEIDVLKRRVKTLEDALIQQDATIKRLLRLVGALR